MKQYNKLLSFGCSFTEGGGLNSPQYHHYLSGYVDDFDLTPKKEYEIYMNNNSYPYYLSKLLNCEFENYGVSRASNEQILDNVYNVLNDGFDLNNTLVTVQTSMLNRILLYLADSGKHTSVNSMINDEDFVTEYYKQYIQHFFDDKNEFTKLLKNIDLYTTYIKSKGIDVAWIILDGPWDYVILEKHIVSFDNKLLGHYTTNNKLTIKDLPNINFNDTHFSPLGNKMIANKIYEHLSKYYD